jgi:hypothetical protein
MQAADDQGKSSKDSWTRLIDKLAATITTTITETAAAPMNLNEKTATSTTTTSTAAASPVKKLLQKFNISSPDKQKLTMELVSEMDTPLKVPLMREVVKGSNMSRECHKNQLKMFVHIPQCSRARHLRCPKPPSIINSRNWRHTGSWSRKGGGQLERRGTVVLQGIGGIDREEYVQTAAHAGITCIS